MTMTHNSGSIVDEGAFSVRRSIRVEATVEKVWAAVTEPAQISRWFGAAAFEGGGAGLVPGAVGSMTWPGREPVPLRVEAVDEPLSVSYRWINPCLGESVPASVDDGPSTVFTFTLVAVPGGTELTVVETGFGASADPAAHLDSHRGGWDGELDRLVTLLEGGVVEPRE